MLRISNTMFVDIDARHSAVACGSEVHRRTTRAASDFQHMAMLAHVHQVCESKPLGGGHPTALPNVFTKRTVAHSSLGAAVEVCVDVVVDIHRVGHLAFLCSARARRVPERGARIIVIAHPLLFRPLGFALRGATPKRRSFRAMRFATASMVDSKSLWVESM